MDDRFYPFELIVEGTPLSLQASGVNKAAWMAKVSAAAMERRDVLHPMTFLDERSVALTLFYFASAPMAGDLDNIVKPILDALNAILYRDDRWIERLVVQKFEPGVLRLFESPSVSSPRSWTWCRRSCMCGSTTISNGGPSHDGSGAIRQRGRGAGFGRTAPPLREAGI